MDGKKKVKVRRDLLEPPLTCPYCQNLLKNATSNTACPHTFCRRCIEEIVTEKDMTECPVCETDWGVNPIQKMRHDHSLQSLRDKLFPENKKAVKATAADVVSSQNSANIEHSDEMMSLISLRTTYKGSSSSGDSQSADPDDEILANIRASISNKKGKKKKNKPRVPRQKKELAVGDSSQSSQEQQASNRTMPLENASSVWLSLEPSENGDGVLLPEIGVPYIRMNGKMPVSLVHKYVQKKLGLESEDEIEITCLGEVVPPEMELMDLYKTWLESVFPDEEITVTVGSSAERFVMNLNYGPKV
ncbi:putative transcription factor C2H2 family [Lupinus albus]|uniref:Putative transcription factor C2H2 family n=1 Tax=Lupinus albus TaxID=3870 RepID=A0A6A4QXM6_LUPAL|nr:putative transcription factor C2H2 family [Lupinus albus]